MSRKYTTSILFKIDAETLSELDRAASELGHSRSLFIRDAIRRRLVDREGCTPVQTMRFAESVSGDSDKRQNA
jgi:metal-responsive CopG/Arc/MetJ family transcriptional regulator